MHLFKTLPVTFKRFEYRKAPELRGAFVEGAYELGVDITGYQLCNLTGEPLNWDEPWDRHDSFNRALTSQEVDGFHL